MPALPDLTLHLSNHGSAREVVEVAVRAEQAGVGGVWLSEDLYYRGALATAAAVAARTQRLQIGFGVIAPQIRHPAALAMETRTLLDLAPGRVVLGVGAGVVERVRAVGKEAGKPLPVVREAVTALRQLLAGETLDEDGSLHRSVGLRLTGDVPADVPPVYVAAVGPKALAQAARLADGVLLTMMCAVQHAEWACGQVRTAATDRPRPPVVAYVPVAIGDDGEAARRHMKGVLAYYVNRWANLEFLSRLFTDWSDLDRERMDRIQQVMHEGGDPAPLISDAVLDAYTVAGTPEQCVAGLQRFAEAGVTSVALDPGGDLAGFANLLDRWGRLTSGGR